MEVSKNFNFGNLKRYAGPATKGKYRQIIKPIVMNLLKVFAIN